MVKEKASPDRKEIKVGDVVFHHWYSTSEWDGGENDFYFDVDDTKGSIFSLEGRVYLDVFGDYGGWASKLLSETFEFTPRLGAEETITESHDGNWLKLTFETKTVSRSNTIAVYENGTYSPDYGRYYGQDKMVVVQLDINEESFGIWKKGANTIVIQKAAFASTKLNAAIQQAVDATGTVNWFSMPPCLTTNAELSGLDRQNAASDASEWLELTIAKTECSIDDANAILNLLLTGMVNETTGEEGIINAYDANPAHVSELMNLPIDALKTISLEVGSCVNDRQGDKPKEFSEWMKNPVENTIKLLTGLLAAVSEWIEDALAALVALGLKFVEKFAPWLMVLIEAILKTALLAWIYIMYGLALYSVVTSFLIMASILIPFALTTHSYYKIGFLSLEISIFGMNLKSQTILEWIYNSFFDLNVPIIISDTYINDMLIYRDVKGIITDIFEEKIPETSHFTPYLTEPNYNLEDSDIQLYRFVIVYSNTNGYAPMEGFPKINLYKDGNYITTYHTEQMMPVEGSTFDYLLGVAYEVIIEIPDEGEYEYEIELVDNSNEYVTTGKLLGPIITEDVKPKLENSKLDPDFGFAFDTIFKFTIEYSEPHGYGPENNELKLILYKDDIKYNEYKMKPQNDDPTEEDYIDGVIFEANITIADLGNYKYEIEAYEPITNERTKIEKSDGLIVTFSITKIISNIATAMTTVFSIGITLNFLITATTSSKNYKIAEYGIQAIIYGAFIWALYQILNPDIHNAIFQSIGAGIGYIIAALIINNAIQDAMAKVKYKSLEDYKNSKINIDRLKTMLRVIGVILSIAGVAISIISIFYQMDYLLSIISAISAFLFFRFQSYNLAALLYLSCSADTAIGMTHYYSLPKKFLITGIIFFIIAALRLYYLFTGGS